VTAAVLINHRKSVDAEGKVTYTPIAEAEMTQIQALVREAIGFNKERGDSINIVNAPFSQEPVLAATEIAWWKDPSNISLGKEIGKGFAMLAGLLIVVFGVIRPAIKSAASAISSEPAEPKLIANQDGAMPALPSPDKTENQVDRIREIAKNDPAIVANVVRQWVGNNG
jgi:flagellar M-ring protein FliF